MVYTEYAHGPLVSRLSKKEGPGGKCRSHSVLSSCFNSSWLYVQVPLTVLSPNRFQVNALAPGVVVVVPLWVMLLRHQLLGSLLPRSEA